MARRPRNSNRFALAVLPDGLSGSRGGSLHCTHPKRILAESRHCGLRFSAAWAAARRATGTRGPEQLT
jgi:hypothetical protein